MSDQSFQKLIETREATAGAIKKAALAGVKLTKVRNDPRSISEDIFAAAQEWRDANQDLEKRVEEEMAFYAADSESLGADS